MRFTVLTQQQKRQLQKEKERTWNKWFAWHPVRLTADTNTMVWMEPLYRKSSCPDGMCPDCAGCWDYATSTLDILKIDDK